jgi:hypothetical protein
MTLAPPTPELVTDPSSAAGRVNFVDRRVPLLLMAASG